MSACTFAYGIAKSDKTVKESLDIADDLFVLLAKGNGLNPNNIFDGKDLVKQPIRVETIIGVSRCNEWTKASIPKLFLKELPRKQLRNLLMVRYELLVCGG